MFVKQPLVTELQHSVRMLHLNNEATVGLNYEHPKLFIFSTGTIVSWGQSENVLQALMTLMRPVEVESLSATIINQEREVLQYQLTANTTSLRNGIISLSTQIEDDDTPLLDESEVERESLVSHQIEDRKVGLSP
jgi:uncharacterized Rmd1/YagE family protein